MYYFIIIFINRQTKEAIKFSLRTSGVASLWRGWGPLMWRDVPFSGETLLCSFTIRCCRVSMILLWHHQLCALLFVIVSM